MNMVKSEITFANGKVSLKTTANIAGIGLVNFGIGICTTNSELITNSDGTFKFNFVHCPESIAKVFGASSEVAAQSNELTPPISGQNSESQELPEKTGESSCPAIASGKQQNPALATIAPKELEKVRSEHGAKHGEGVLNPISIAFSETDPKKLAFTLNPDSKHLSDSDVNLFEFLAVNLNNFGINPIIESLVTFDSGRRSFKTNLANHTEALRLLQDHYNKEIEPNIKPMDQIDPVDFVRDVGELKSQCMPKTFKRRLRAARLALTYFANKEVKEAEALINELWQAK